MAMREAFDFHNPICRKNFWRQWRAAGLHPWRRRAFLLRMAWNDTRNNVCPAQPTLPPHTGRTTSQEGTRFDRRPLREERQHHPRRDRD